MANITVKPYSEDNSWWQAAPLAQGGSPSAAPSPYADAISSVESGGNYHAIGPATKNGDRALGRYQIMGANVGPWSKEILGREVTPQEFFNSPEIQDAIFSGKFGSYVNKYGPEGAARAWFAGEGGMNDPNRRDVLGTSVADYSRKFTGALGYAQEQPRAPAKPQEDNSWWQSAPIAQEPKQQAAPQPQSQPQPQAETQQQPGVGMGEAIARGAANGATFNFYDELRGLMEAGGLNPKDPASLVSLVQGAYRYFSGDPAAAQKYDNAATRERAASAAAEKERPYSSIVGNVAGAVALPVGPLMQAATLPGRMAAGAGVGAGMGALYGAGGGQGTADRVSGAVSGGLVGGAVGGLAPAVIEGVVRGAKSVAAPVVNTARGLKSPDAEASRRVMEALKRDAASGGAGLSPSEMAAARSQGVPVANMDMGGETTRALARSAANTSPEGRQVLNNAINDRFEGQAGRVVGWLRRVFNYPDARAQQQAIDRVQQTVNRANYNRAYQAGDRPLWSPELERLAGSPAVEGAMRSAITTGKDRAINEGMGGFRVPITVTPDGRVVFNRGPNGVPTYPNLQFWDYVRREVSDAASAAQRAGRNEEGARLGQLARSLNSELDRLVPEYAAARAGAARFFGAENALEAGQNFVTQNFANADVRRALAQMSPEERRLFQDGFVSRFIEQLNQTGDRRSILNQIANSPNAREKLNIALGQQRAAELEAGLRVEGIMDFARSAVQGNSTTARQLAELGLAGGTYGLGTGGDVLNPNPSALMNAALVYGVLRGKARIDERVARRVAEMLVSSDPRILVRGIQVLSRSKQLFNSLRAFDASLARVGATQSPGAVQLPALGRAQDDKQSVPRPPGQ